jgi:hypothetical protein
MTHYQQRLSFGRGFESGAWQYLGTLDDPTDSYIYLGLESVDEVNNKALNAPLNQKIVLGLNDFVLNNIKISPFNQGKSDD